MTSEISFNVRGNPVGQNAAWRIIQLRGHGAMMLTAEGSAWKYEVSRIALASRPPDWDLDNEYIVECVWYFDSRRPDCDGPAKLTLDALAELKQGNDKREVLMRNDRQIWMVVQRRELDRQNPRAEITIRLRNPPKPQQPSLL